MSAGTVLQGKESYESFYGLICTPHFYSFVMNMSLYRVFLNFQIELADVISLYYDQTGSFVKDFVMVILNFCSPCDVLSPG